MGPAEPATVGALVNVHILQVHVHADNAPVREKEAGKESGQECRRKEGKREVEILRGVNKRNKWNWRIKYVQQEWKKSETEQEGRWKQAERRHVDYTDAGEVRMKGKKIKNRKEEQCSGEVRLKVQQAGEGRCSRTGGIGINWKGEELRVMEVSNEKEERDRGKEKEAGSDS